MIDSVRLSEKGKNQLIVLKRRTGIQNWNVLCRWAFCLSLREKSEPAPEDIPTDSNVEMTWKTFTGGLDEVYMALLLSRAESQKIDLDKSHVNRYFRLHLHRGISYLFGNPKLQSIEALVRLAV